MYKALVGFLIKHKKKVVVAMGVINLFFLSQIFRIQMFSRISSRTVRDPEILRISVPIS